MSSTEAKKGIPEIVQGLLVFLILSIPVGGFFLVSNGGRGASAETAEVEAAAKRYAKRMAREIGGSEADWEESFYKAYRHIYPATATATDSHPLSKK